jgi:hypothetical protein
MSASQSDAPNAGNTARARAFESMGRNADAIAALSRDLADACRRPSHISRQKQIEIAVELSCRQLALARDVERYLGSPTVYE